MASPESYYLGSIGQPAVKLARIQSSRAIDERAGRSPWESSELWLRLPLGFTRCELEVLAQVPPEPGSGPLRAKTCRAHRPQPLGMS